MRYLKSVVNLPVAILFGLVAGFVFAVALMVSSFRANEWAWVRVKFL